MNYRIEDYKKWRTICWLQALAIIALLALLVLAGLHSPDGSKVMNVENLYYTHEPTP